MLDVRACLEVFDTAEPACPSPVAVQSVLPSTRRTVSALRTRFTMLNALPTRAAVNASPTASRQPAHDSRRTMNWLLLCSKRLSLSVHSPVSLAVLLSPLVEPDVPISGIRLSSGIMPFAHGKPRAHRPGGCGAVPRARPGSARLPGPDRPSRRSHRQGRPVVPDRTALPAIATHRAATPFASACGALWTLRTLSGGTRLSPLSTAPSSFLRHSQTKAPSLRRRYPASPHMCCSRLCAVGAASPCRTRAGPRSYST